MLKMVRTRFVGVPVCDYNSDSALLIDVHSLLLVLKGHFRIECTVLPTRYSRTLHGLFDPLALWPALGQCYVKMFSQR